MRASKRITHVFDCECMQTGHSTYVVDAIVTLFTIQVFDGMTVRERSINELGSTDTHAVQMLSLLILLHSEIIRRCTYVTVTIQHMCQSLDDHSLLIEHCRTHIGYRM